jgi:L-fuconolactonase
MRVIDSHHHFWWLAKHTYKWPEAAGDRLSRDFTPADLEGELEACGIDGTVLIQVLHGDGETSEYLDIAQQVDFVRGVVGWVPLADPPAAARALDELGECDRLVGIRHLISTNRIPNGCCRGGCRTR